MPVTAISIIESPTGDFVASCGGFSATAPTAAEAERLLLDLLESAPGRPPAFVVEDDDLLPGEPEL